LASRQRLSCNYAARLITNALHSGRYHVMDCCALGMGLCFAPWSPIARRRRDVRFA